MGIGIVKACNICQVSTLDTLKADIIGGSNTHSSEVPPFFFMMSATESVSRSSVLASRRIMFNLGLV